MNTQKGVNKGFDSDGRSVLSAKVDTKNWHENGEMDVGSERSIGPGR
jgi:hypothetical protein